VLPTRLRAATIRAFYSISLKQRIWFAFVALITAAILATGTISYLIASREIQQNAFRSSRETVDQSARILDERLKNIGVAIRALMFSESFKNVLEDAQSGNRARYYGLLTSLQYVFSQVQFNDSMIDGILIATPIGDFYPTNSIRDVNHSFYESDLYRQFKEKGAGFWTKGHTDPFFKDHKRVISLVVEGIDGSVTKNTNVYVVVNVKENALRSLYMQNLSGTDKHYFFLDSTGEEVLRTEDDGGALSIPEPDIAKRFGPEKTGSFFYKYNSHSYLLNYTRLDAKDDWVLVGMQSKSALLSRIGDIQKATTLAIVGFVLISLLISNRLTYYLLRPLHRLQKLMRRVEERNDLNVRFETPYRDEVSQVGYRFNLMLDEINQLIANVREGEEEKRRTEIKALTSQMNPHFFYNTLNTIYCKSVLGENDDVNEMIMALSRMFQLGLSSGRDIIPLRDELDHVMQYVAIQQTSYDGLFTYETDIDPQCLDLPVPKVVIQPLVENCILHGFKDLTAGGWIRVSATLAEGRLRIVVEDNGTGLAPEQLTAEDVPADRDGDSYALRNITSRLQWLYDGAGAIAWSNREQGGARVELQLPVKTEGRDSEWIA